MSSQSHGPGEMGIPSDAAVPPEVLQDLVARAKHLLGELEVFRERLRTLKQEGTVEYAHFRSTVQSELNMLERLAAKPEGEVSCHVTRSSNLPFLETVWGTSKKSHGLVAMQKRLFPNLASKDVVDGMQSLDVNPRKSRRTRGPREDAVLVDVIADDGRTWSKVSLVTNNRLMFDLAKQGWDSGGSSDEDGNDFGTFVRFGQSNGDRNTHVINGQGFSGLDDDDDMDVPLLKTAKDLCKAALMTRTRTHHPRVQLVLPRIIEGEVPQIDRILASCRSIGAIVLTSVDSKTSPPLGAALPNMAPDPALAFSNTLNIDCTILLALVSEFSHATVSQEPWFHTALQRQAEIEESENLLPNLLYPALGDRELVCTQAAAKRMREIVDTIGTPSEKARTALLLGDEPDGCKNGTNEAAPSVNLVERMQALSSHKVPSHWRLPIRVINDTEETYAHLLPAPALEPSVSGSMTTINRSVFLYGWAKGYTTITSNRAVVKQIEASLEDGFVDLDEDVWPKIWLCPTARSLVGREKRGQVSSRRKRREGQEGESKD